MQQSYCQSKAIPICRPRIDSVNAALGWALDKHRIHINILTANNCATIRSGRYCAVGFETCGPLANRVPME